MIKNNVAIIGIGLAGETVGYDFQQRNYNTLLINGSIQDNNTLPNAKNVMVLEGYDGLAGNRELAFEALKNNKDIVKKITQIEEKIIFVIASGGGTTGSGSISHICDILCNNPEKTVCAILLMPTPEESIKKRLNAYNAAKELMEIAELGATIFVNNASNQNLKAINYNLVTMLDAFFSDTSSSSGSNFDDSEKMRMLQDNGAFVISMMANKKSQDKVVTTQEMINVLTAKNIFLPINNDGVVSNIGIINQKENHIEEKEIVKAIGTPENIFTGNNGTVNIVCASGLGFPVDYITNLGKKALEEQKDRINRRKALSILDDLEIEEPTDAIQKPIRKRKALGLDLLHELD